MAGRRPWSGTTERHETVSEKMQTKYYYDAIELKTSRIENTHVMLGQLPHSRIRESRNRNFRTGLFRLDFSGPPYRRSDQSCGFALFRKGAGMWEYCCTALRNRLETASRILLAQRVHFARVEPWSKFFRGVSRATNSEASVNVVSKMPSIPCAQAVG